MQVFGSIASKTVRRTFLHVCHLGLVLGICDFCCCGCLFLLLARFLCFCRKKHLNLRLQGLHLTDITSFFSVFVPDFSSLTSVSCFASSLLSSFLSSVDGASDVSFFSSSFRSPSSLPSVFWPGDALCDVSFVKEESYGKERRGLYHSHKGSLFRFAVKKISFNGTEKKKHH